MNHKPLVLVGAGSIAVEVLKGDARHHNRAVLVFDKFDLLWTNKKIDRTRHRLGEGNRLPKKRNLQIHSLKPAKLRGSRQPRPVNGMQITTLDCRPAQWSHPLASGHDRSKIRQREGVRLIVRDENGAGTLVG